MYAIFKPGAHEHDVSLTCLDDEDNAGPILKMTMPDPTMSISFVPSNKDMKAIREWLERNGF